MYKYIKFGYTYYDIGNNNYILHDGNTTIIYHMFDKIKWTTESWIALGYKQEEYKQEELEQIKLEIL